MKGNKPRRSEEDKYFVTKEEYEKDVYPLHCSGAAYVTKTRTMERILSKLETLDYLFIDDIFVTGIAAQGIISHYDWSMSFLENHTGEKDRLLSAEPFFTPELLVAMNLNSKHIGVLYQKAKLCSTHANRCYGILTEFNIQQNKPLQVTTETLGKSEL